MAKRPPWFLNAARRTLHTAVPGLAAPDDDYAAALLSEAELRLFLYLSAPEREHAVSVAKCLERAWAGQPGQGPLHLDGGQRAVALRAALLHDVGKLGASNNVVWRVLTHLLPPSDSPMEPRLGGLAGARQARRHHEAYGEQLILAAGGDPVVARIVGGHHSTRQDGRPGPVPAADPVRAAARQIEACDRLT